MEAWQEFQFAEAQRLAKAQLEQLAKDRATRLAALKVDLDYRRRLAALHADPQWAAVLKAMEASNEYGTPEHTVYIQLCARYGLPMETPAPPDAAPAKPADTPAPAGTRKRRGRMTKEESDTKRLNMLEQISANPTLQNDEKTLAKLVGASERTIRRWLAAGREKHRERQRDNK